jgi:hypothetical protein
MVDDGAGGHADGSLWDDCGHPPRPPVLQLRRQQQVDGHADAVWRLAASGRPAPPVAGALGGGAPAGGAQDGCHLRGHRGHDRLRQPHVLVRAAVPAGVHLLARGRDAAGLQRHHLAPHQRAAVYGADRQLRGRAHLLRRDPRRRILLRRDLKQRAARQVPAGVRTRAGRLGGVRAHFVPLRAHLREGGQGADGAVGAADADAHQPGGVGGVRGGAARVGGLADDPGGDGVVQRREDEVRADAGGHGGVVAGSGRGLGAADHEGVVAVRERDVHAGAAAGASVCGGAVRGQDDRYKDRGHAHGGMGVPLLHVPALHRRTAAGRGRERRVPRLRHTHGKPRGLARLRLRCGPVARQCVVLNAT